MPCDEPILTMRVLASGAYSVSMTGQSASRLRAAAAATGIREVRAEPTIGAAGDVMPIRCRQPSSSIVQSQCLTALATVSSARLRTRRPRPWRCSPHTRARPPISTPPGHRPRAAPPRRSSSLPATISSGRAQRAGPHLCPRRAGPPGPGPGAACPERDDAIGTKGLLAKREPRLPSGPYIER
jgi:hypothetical protein